MIYYGQKNAEGTIVCVGQVEKAVCIPEGCEKLSKTDYDAWIAQRQAEREAREKAKAERPTVMEQVRADIDYLAALQGVSL